jgi:hypothetical protein
MNLSSRIAFWSLCFVLLSVLILSVVSCQNAGESATLESSDEPIETLADAKSYDDFIEEADEALREKWIVDMATYILRKPEHANWETKFDPEFRPFFEKKADELEWIYALPLGDTLYFYLIRDGRDHRGKSNRGVGGKLVLDASNNFQHFEEIFVTKIIDRVNLETIGKQFMAALENGESTNAFIENPSNAIEWPDGRLFYSVQKSEWRYVD